jgi:ribonuclease HI
MFAAAADSTNLRMELVAVIQGLLQLKEPCEIVLVSDSDYVCDGLTTWLPKWKKNGWKTSAGDPVKHLDLWMELDRLSAIHLVRIERPKSNRDIQLNARVDELANRAATTRDTSQLTYLREDQPRR